MRLRRRENEQPLQCSFCHKPEHQVGKLISSPSEYPRAYICDECIAVCNSILEDDRAPEANDSGETPDGRHPWIDHPSASALLAAIERWIQRESLGGDAAEEFAEMHTIALMMLIK